MSIKREKREKHYTETVTVEQRCDLCGKAAPMPSDPWASGSFDIDETSVELRHRKGSSYPEGGSATEIIFDVCPDCFRGKVVPWMESQGAKPRSHESDW